MLKKVFIKFAFISIQAPLQELYSVEVSPTLISNITDAVMEEVKQWQARPIEQVYPIV